MNGISWKPEDNLWLGMVICDPVHVCIGNSKETEDGFRYPGNVLDSEDRGREVGNKRGAEESLMKIIKPLTRE